VSPSAFSPAAILAAVWAYFTEVDTGLLVTLRRLCAAPGALVAEQLAKRQHVFREPLRLFVFANLLFFLVGPQVGLFRYTLQELEGSYHAYPELTAEQQVEFGLTRDVYEERFDNHLSFRQPTFAVLLVPLLALFAKLFDLRRPFGVHLMFGLYAVSWILLSWPVLLWSADTLFAVFDVRDPGVTGFSKLVLLTVGTAQWFARAQIGGYGRGVATSLLQGALLTASWVVVMLIYGQLLFWLTYALLPAG